MEKRTKDNPWKLKTPPGTSDYEMYVDTKDGKEIIVCTVGSTVLHYDYRALADLHEMLKKHGDWMELGSKDEKQEAAEGTDLESDRKLQQEIEQQKSKTGVGYAISLPPNLRRQMVEFRTKEPAIEISHSFDIICEIGKFVEFHKLIHLF